MLIGVPKEIKPQENRVGLSADSVKTLVSEGNRVIVETGAGIGSGFTDTDYAAAGASICKTAKEIFDISELIIKVKEPQKQEVELLKKFHSCIFHSKYEYNMSSRFYYKQIVNKIRTISNNLKGLIN